MFIESDSLFSHFCFQINAINIALLTERQSLAARDGATVATAPITEHWREIAATDRPCMNLKLRAEQISDIVAQARLSSPNECCGLIGGTNGEARTVYRMRNIARNPLVTYEAAPEDLFSAQRRMRERGEQLIAIYHSHPRAKTPEPSATDVRLAYYPSAVYLIVGLGNDEPCVRAFEIDQRSEWRAIDYQIVAG